MTDLASHLHGWLVERQTGLQPEAPAPPSFFGLGGAGDEAGGGDERQWRNATFGSHLLLALEALGVLQGLGLGLLPGHAAGGGGGDVQEHMFDALK